jgi:methionine synthase II (cobalamin-independent)
MSERYRADQVGSLLRPSELIQARAALSNGQMSLEELRKVEDHAILDALQLQRETGVEVFTDGGFRRGSFMGDLADAVEGFIFNTGEREWRGPGASTKRGAFGRVVGAKLRQTRRLTVHESLFLREHSPGAFKITIPSPSLLAFVAYKPGLTSRFYPARLDLLRALTETKVCRTSSSTPRYTRIMPTRNFSIGCALTVWIRINRSKRPLPRITPVWKRRADMRSRLGSTYAGAIRAAAG